MKLFTVKEAAQYLEVDEQTIRNYYKNGTITEIMRKGRGGKVWITKQQLDNVKDNAWVSMPMAI